MGLYIVADGVGGLKKGEIASKLACKTVLESIRSGSTLSKAIDAAHQEIITEVKDDESKFGMATTIVAVLFRDDSYEIAWVGDSRAYLWDDSLSLITLDDSYVELLLAGGHISEEELETHPNRNVISQALGIERKELEIHTNSGTLLEDQILFICSDGLYGVAKELDIIQAINSTTQLDSLTKNLVDTAVKNQGKDNITLLTIALDEPSKNAKNFIKPHIYRQFDLLTGKIKGFENRSGGQQNLQNDPIETNAELADQTVYKKMTADEQNLLNSAAKASEQQPKISKNILPILLFLIVVLLIVFFNLNY